MGEDADGNAVIPSLEDPEHVNQRRAAIGMIEPLSRYAAHFPELGKGRGVHLQDDAQVVPVAKPVRPELAEIPRNDEAVFAKSGVFDPNIDEAALKKITLADTPSKDDVDKYVRAIEESAKHQRTHNSSDPQVAMLQKVGAENLDVLLHVSANDTWYINVAIERMARPEDKAAVLKELPRNHGLLSTVKAHEWLADARPILISTLHRGEKVGMDWVAAVVMIKDPDTYDDLKAWFAIYGNEYTWKTFHESIPDLDLSDAVAKLWEQCKQGKPWDINRAAPVAARYGNLDALEVLTHSFDEQYVGEQRRATFSELTGAQGNSQELKAWWEKYKGQLVFDGKAGKFKGK